MSTSETTLTTTVAGMASMRHRRSSMPNVAKKAPVTTNIRSPSKAVRADGGHRFAADHDEPADDDQRAENAGGGSGSFSTNAASRMPNSAAQDGWITPPWASGTSRKPE